MLSLLPEIRRFLPTLYADDVMIFCSAKMSGIQNLKNLFIEYANCSDQKVNPAKSSIFSSSISPTRLASIVDQLGFSVGSLPFTYLGVPIFRGKPKASYLQPIANKIKIKLANWKASLLSMAGRVQLVKAVIQSMLIHCLSVYSWSISILKEIERNIRNFIWSGDIEKRKLVTIAWHRVCKPVEGGRSLSMRLLI
jgi:hypothetical protein